MDTAAACQLEYSAFEAVMYLAFELSNIHWKLGFTTGPGQRPRQRTIHARDLTALENEIRRAKERFDLPKDARVVSCTVLRQHGLRGWPGRFLAPPLSGGGRDREPGSGQLEHPGEPASPAGKDRPNGC